MRMSHTGKKTLLTGYILDPTFTISKTLQQRKAIANNVWTKELKAMNMLKQRRDEKMNFIWTLPFLLQSNYFSDNYLEVLNPGIKSVKNIWNLKQVWITPKSLSHFRPFSQVFLKMCSWGMTFKYHITGNSSVFL